MVDLHHPEARLDAAVAHSMCGKGGQGHLWSRSPEGVTRSTPCPSHWPICYSTSLLKGFSPRLGDFLGDMNWSNTSYRAHYKTERIKLPGLVYTEGVTEGTGSTWP